MITFDDASWPLLTVSFTGKNSSQDFDAYLTRLSEYLQRGDKHAVIIDTQGLSAGPTLEQRQRQVGWVQANLSALRLRSLGTAFVINSPFIRLALNIVYQIQPLPTPYTIVGDLKMARHWALERFQAAGLTLPVMASPRRGSAGAGSE
ncbi:hypothetical protein [Melittangium boletus]|uniref:STAS/SEC14 domain-containing protein n=1 Tax=Melittangium boletus DSM 14713 TaxID=1294270 RepID=A0A250I8Q0_9BACT|nr:hypothetical protein [Melittangium boletus]ATB27507.1 hypothetical protein MEBOL_000950 [Melittangium boletus DSM 14713]